MKRKRTHHSCAPPNAFWRYWRIVLVAIALLHSSGAAQDIIVNGTMTNTGKIRVKNQTVVAQSSVGGELELKGADQILPAKQYQYVRLSGSGTKTTSGGNFSVAKNLTIASSVTLNILKGTFITLGDSLFELGTLKGAIQKSENLSGTNTNSNFGNIGAQISWSDKAPGNTTVMRVSDSVQFGNGNQSIKRYYQIQPTDATATGTITLKFSDSELNGHNISHLQLWRSTDNGATWVRHIPVVDEHLRTISKSNVPLAGRWTVADTLNPIGPLNAAAGIPAILASTGAQTIPPIILTTLSPLKVLVTDLYGTPVKNVPVTFAISKKPLNTTGETLSKTVDTTDADGIAQTTFTLGSKVGEYEVSASYGSLTPVTFPITAKHGAAHALAKATTTTQVKPILSQLDSAFKLIVTDIGGNFVDSAQVQFSFVLSPSGATGQTLSATTVFTDSLGQASTLLTLGDKVGTYSVRAKVTGITNDSATFVASATAGAAASLAASSGNNQEGINGAPLSAPFVVAIKDIGGNAVQGANVKFKLNSVPPNALGTSLSDTLVATNAFGEASSILTLGTKIGNYEVLAELPTQSGTLSFKFVAKAKPSAPAVMNLVSGANQTAPIFTQLANDFVVNVVDANGNPVDSATVTFSIDSTNGNGAGATLSALTTKTDSNGNASTRLTLGSKVGTYKVNASVNSVPVVTFNAQALPGAASAFASMAGSNQSAVILTQLGNEFALKVLDAGGNNVPGITVNFAIDSIPLNATGQQLSKLLDVSDSLGFVRTKLTLGNKVGTYRVKASRAGISDVQFIATAQPGAPATMAAVSTLNQTKQILTALDSSFAVRVTDIGGNNVPSSNVRFTITSKPNGTSGELLSDSVTITDSLGIAKSRLTLGSKVGTYEVTALIPSLSQEVKFSASATHGAPAVYAKITGGGQTQPTLSVLDSALVVAINDIGGNAVPNTDVKFTITQIPTNAIGQALQDSVVKTDSLGVASTLFKLGNREGTYKVTASVAGMSSTTFVSEAFYIYGDPNSDFNINIADITMLVDAINKKLVISDVDSIKADLNKDGKLDTLDIVLLRENILSRSIFAKSFGSFYHPFLMPKYTAAMPEVNAANNPFTGATTQFEATPQGLRLNMTNTVPVRGVELRIRVKDSTLNVETINYLFSRARQMSVLMKTENREVRLLAYNLANNEIQPGEGSLLRIPKITSLNQIDTANVVLALANNIAVTPQIEVTAAPAGKYPVTYQLLQNYPNPFNAGTTIRYEIPDTKTAGTNAAVQIFNMLGQKVKTLVYAEHDPGTYSITWDGTNDAGTHVASGVYFYRLITKTYVTTKKMVYVK